MLCTQETVHIWIELLPTTQVLHVKTALSAACVVVSCGVISLQVTDIQVDMTSKELLVKGMSR